MSFQGNLATMSDIAHLSGLNVRDAAGNIVRTSPAAPGKLGSLKLYNALAQEYSGRLNAESAERGLTLFAEHTTDAAANPGKHPNIDLLFEVKAKKLNLTLEPIEA